MDHIVLFHHPQGLTNGMCPFADELRGGGHTVLTPDLFAAERPATIDEGVALTQTTGPEVLRQKADRAVADLPLVSCTPVSPLAPPPRGGSSGPSWGHSCPSLRVLPPDQN